MNNLSHKKYRELSDEDVAARLHNVDDERLFIVYEALRRGTSVDTIHEITMIDEWFLNKFLNLINMERRLGKEGHADFQRLLVDDHAGIVFPLFWGEDSRVQQQRQTKA